MSTTTPDNKVLIGLSNAENEPENVLDFGLWARVERDELRARARARGYGVELHYLDVAVEELWRRVEARNSEPPWDAAPISRGHLDEWLTVFEPPDAAELALFDRPPPS